MSLIAQYTHPNSGWIKTLHDVLEAVQHESDLNAKTVRQFFVFGSVAAKCLTPVNNSTKEENFWATLDQNLRALNWGYLQSYVKTWKGNEPILYVRVKESVFAQRRDEKKQCAIQFGAY